MPTNQNNVPTYHSAFLKVWFYFFFYSHYKIQIKHFDFAFRGLKFLETEGSNFCGEGSFTPLLPHNHKIMQKKIKSLRSHPMCRKPFISAVYPIFCSFPLYQLSEFYFYVNAVFDTIRFCLCTFWFCPILFDFAYTFWFCPNAKSKSIIIKTQS